jgi:transposase
MEDKKYRTYAEEFKLEALELLKRGEKSAGEIEGDLGITPGLLIKWKARYQAIEKGDQQTCLVPSDLESAKTEIRRLRKELVAVEEEREILKKALCIFSRRSV